MAGLVPANHANTTFAEEDADGRDKPVHDRKVKPRGSSVSGRLERVLDGFDRRELDIVQLAVDPFDPSDIDVLDDVAGLRVDRNGTARACPARPFIAAISAS